MDINQTAGMNDPFVIQILVFLGVLSVMLLIAGALMTPSTNIDKRIKSLDKRRSETRSDSLKNMDKKKGYRRLGRSHNMMKMFVKKTSKVEQEEDKVGAVQKKLYRAGIRDREAIYPYFFFKMAGPIFMGLAAFIYLFALVRPEWSPMMKFIVIGICVFFGYKFPDIYLKNLADKRLPKIKRAFPDALDLMVVCTEAGLGLDAALKRVAQEIGSASPHLGDELVVTNIELSFLEDRKQAFENLAARVPIQSVKSFATALTQTEKYGTPIAQTLRVLSAEFRNERMMEAETKAAQLPVKLTLPLMLCILPPLMLVLMGPAIIQFIDVWSGSGVAN